MLRFLLAAAFASVAHAQTLSSQIPQLLPAGCVPVISQVGTNYLVQCSNTPPPPTPPASCSISGLPSGSVPAPYTYALSAVCAAGGAPTAWQWSGGSTAVSQAIGGQVSATTAFGVVASNAAGSAPQANGTITVGGSGPTTCSGYSNTLQMPLTWGKPGSASNYYSSQLGTFGQTSALVIKFTTPAGTSTTALGNISISEYQGPVANRWANKTNAGFSLASCDFTTAISYGQEPSFYFTIGPNSMGAQALQPSTTYYLNVHNDASCGASTPAPGCSVLVTLKQPTGL